MQKICKLVVQQLAYFKIFDKVLKNSIPFVEELQNKVKLSIFHKIGEHWFTPARLKLGHEFDGLSADQMALLASFINAPHKKMAIDGVYSVATESCMGPEARTQKFFNFGGEEDREFYRVSKNLSSSFRETMVHRIALQEWHYDQFYLNQILRYCKKCRMMTIAEIENMIKRRTASKTN